MTDTELRTAVRESVAELLTVPLTADTDHTLLAELAPGRYDSLGVLDCVGLIEQRFDVSVDLVEDDLRSTFASVAAIAALVARKQSDQAVLRAAL
ncbi:acyl carrier protein [Micromonospora zhanjiangensis]|uniref:Acyl carrier protein n=1 Tax=Micromonospora zhanjiangensis TaxID=1522057 RepID=A0ABV8KF11_9ACTN